MTVERIDRASRWDGLSEREQTALTARLSRSSNGQGSPARTRVVPRAGDGPVPLSFAQQRLWFLDQLVPGNPFYNIPAVLPWQGPLSLSALQTAVDELVRRHESLRTTFASTGSTPVQVVHPAEPFAIRLLDLRGTPTGQRSGAVDLVTAHEAGAPFDLAVGPLLRVCVVRFDDADYRVLFTMHHIVSDGWSMSVLLSELATLYTAALQGRPSPLPEPELQYADFAVWQRSWLSGERLATQLDYWRRRLADVPTLELPTDFPRPEVASYRGANLPVRIEPDVAAAVRSLAAAERATPFMVLLAAWAAVLQRATGQTDLAIGAPIANRQRPELEPLIGFFVNSLVLRIDTSDDPDGRDLIRRVKKTAVEAYAHQDLPFEKLVEELRPDRDLSRNPFAQVTLQLQNTPTATGDLPDDHGGTPPVPDTRTSILDLAVSLWETRTALVGMAQFTTDLFEPDTIRQLMDSYGVLLADLVVRPDTAISRLRLLTDDRRQRSIEGSSGPSMDMGPHVALHDLVLQACRTHPEAAAVMSESGLLTYGELERWSARIAVEIHALGVAPGTTIGVRTGRQPAMVAAFLGVLRAGCAYLPIDEDLPERRLRAVLADAHTEVVLTTGPSSSAESLPAGVRHVPVPPLDDARDGRAPTPVAVAPEDPAYVLFTSGSTGAPLGIAVPHRSIVNHMRWMLTAFPLDRRDRVLQRTPVHFDASVWEVWAPLIAGARLVLYPGRWAADTGALVDVLRTAKVTVLQVVPSLLRMLLDEPAFVLSDHLRRVCCGGEELTRELVERFHHLWPGGQSRELINLYGPTEATIDATAWRCSPGDPHARVPIGRPIANTTAYVLDQYHEPVPVGFPGELYLAGEGLATGYVGRPELTAERFVTDPFSPARRLMHRTGDLVRRRPDGTLEFLRRTDDLLKVRGVRIEPAEIERCLVEHAEVERALVVARTGRFGDEELVAYVAVGSAADDARAEPDLVDEHVEDWRTLYQDVYRGDGTEPATDATTDPAFDTVGWNSSYDGLPIGDDEMRSWLDETVERVLALRPTRVLEVGAGTGLIALRVAPHCEDYLALDFSGAAVTALRAAAEECGVTMRVDQRAAHELSTLADGEFDVVIVNSVVQYFPGLAYLEAALAAAANRLTPDGTVFVGDVRSLPLLAPFHASVVIDGVSGQHGDLRLALEERLVEERELVIDPRWFTGLSRRLDDIRSVVVRPKTAAHATEMTRFRYDVVLSRTSVPSERADVRYLDWARDVRTPERLVAVLAATDVPVAVLGVPNDRVAPDARVVAALARGEIGDTTEVGRLRDAATTGIDPHTAVELARAAGLTADVVWTRTGPEGSFDLVVAPAPTELEETVAQVAEEQRPTSIDGAAATAPLRRRVGQRLIPVLRRSAEERLPSSMVPNRFVVLPHLPLRPNGKVDRAALPAPDGERPAGEADFVPPTGALESVLAEAWADVLAIRRVGADDDFFADLGGHSLLATQLISSVRELLESDVPLRTVFEAPTVAKMAAAMLEQLPAVDADRLQRRAGALLRIRDMTDDETEALLDSSSDP